MTLNFAQSRQFLQDFQFRDLFIQQLGWSYPSRDKIVPIALEGETYSCKSISELLGVSVFEVTAAKGEIPNATTRLAIYKQIAEFAHENLLIFIDQERTQSVWYWVKREDSKIYPHDHVYVKREPCDLLLTKVIALYVDIDELESLSVIDVAQRLQAGWDVERVTKKFFEEFKTLHLEFLGAIGGIDKETDRRWYTSVLLNRLMFVYFLQRKGFLDGGKTLYLQEKLEECNTRGPDLFYSVFLKTLFFEGFAKPRDQREPNVLALIGDVKYLNGGLFLKHKIEQDYPHITIPDRAFEKVFDLFSRYSWNLDDTIGGKENEINPAVLGYIFEKYINQKAFGAYYTRSEITEYLCDKTINKLILDLVNQKIAPRKFENMTELLTGLDGNICRLLLDEILPNLSLLDPACGSGAFLVAAMKTLIYVYSTVIGRIHFLTDHSLNDWLKKIESEHLSLNYYIKKRIITDNLYGVDIMEEATEIAKLRLFLALVSSAHDVSELEPLPNIDFNIMAGNSLIGLIRVDQMGFDAVQPTTKGKGKKKDSEPVALQGNLLQPLAASAYQGILADKNASIDLYKKHAFQSVENEGTSQESRLLLLRSHIEKLNQESQDKLNLLLLDEFSTRLGIKYEEVQLSGKAKKRLLMVDDIANLKPFHWGYHFDRVLERGGFDAIITNPPWETFQPDAKEFFLEYSETVSKKKMDVQDFEAELERILVDESVKQEWLKYKSEFVHQREFFRFAEQYKNQVPIINGKRHGKDVNLYKLFVEQCVNLLRSGGECGIVIPSGIYTDLGAKKLREILFSQNRVTGLFCFENRRLIFEGVDSRFKFVVLNFEKGGTTQDFPAQFMRHDVQELQHFPDENSPLISVDLIKKLSPDSLSIMELKNKVEFQIAEKVIKFPLLGEKLDNKWNLELHREFNMTDDTFLFHKKQTPGMLPLYEGKMIHKFTHLYAEPRYWVNETEARKALLGKKIDNGQQLDYQFYRFAYRAIARSTDSRTLIGTILPSKVVCGNSLNIASPTQENKYILFICAALNSFCVDFALRQQVSANINMFYIYQTPVPRLTTGDKYFKEIVQRAAQLICTTPEFDELAQEVGLGSHKNGVTEEEKRGKLRAELDGIIAHLYGLTEEEFAYILTTFPIVSETVKIAALHAYRDVERGLI
jgi:Alw26I/Eco31I/Esp3I family type II restriction m6 adenine DNA methyltransferase